MEEKDYCARSIMEELGKAVNALSQNGTVQEGLVHLKNANFLFIEETNRLRASYGKLQEEFQKVHTELKEVNQKLLQKAQELHTLSQYLGGILSNISQGLIFINTQGLILSFNEAAQKILQKEAKDLLFKHYAHYFREDFFGFSMQDALHFGLSLPTSYLTLHQEGGPRKEVEVTTSFLYEGMAPYQGIIILLRDITEMQRLQLINARNDRMKELGEMVSTVAHEIRNPLGGISGYAALLDRELQMSPALKEMASNIIEGTKTLDRLLAQVLHYARPLNLELLSSDLANFLRKVCKFAKMDPAFPANVHLTMHLSQDPIFAPIDPEALHSCLLNLIVNAYQAMPEGGTITVSLFKQDLFCLISVSDTGNGIEEKNIKQLFSPFFTTKSFGNGLGLAETFKIVQAHSGAIDVRSKVSEGTTFTITLPLKR